MDTGTIARLERRIKATRSSLETWRAQHAVHNDAASHRCYSRALLQHLTVLQVSAEIVGLTHDENGGSYLQELDNLTAEWEAVDTNVLRHV